MSALPRYILSPHVPFLHEPRTFLNSDGSYTVQNRNTGLVLDVFNQSTSPGAIVEQWTAKGGANQQWNIVQAS